MKLSILLTLLFLTACSSAPKHSIVYSSSWTQDRQDAIMYKCKSEAIILTLKMYEQNRYWTGSDVNKVERFILESCYKHYRIVI
jgi:hypothetical protein